MNIEFKSIFGRVEPTLPLKESGHIVCGNATRLDWEEVCPKRDGDEIYVLGNPPYLGSSMQNNEQKDELASCCKGFKNYKNLDYIACWFIKGADYIRNSKTKLAFVSTNSVCQGEQVALLWPHVLKNDLEIGFAHTSFRWVNNAKGNAGVTVSIIGLRSISKELKFLFHDGHSSLVGNINAYLTGGRNIFIPRTGKPISKIPEMVYGNKPVDGGNLILSDQERTVFLQKFPESERFFKKLVGSSEFIKGNYRWCIWIPDRHTADDPLILSLFGDRFEKVRKMRLSSRDKGANDLAKRSHQFRDLIIVKETTIIVPRVSSERREYIPCGFLDADTVILDSAQAIYDADPWIFGVISSRMHMTWVRAVAGRLKTDYRYSSALCYNTFPIPTLTTKQKDEITRHVYEVLEEREKHSEKTMAQLYDPEKMPQGLKEAHHSLDQAIERIYRSKPFTSDEERLEYLFDLYSKMVRKDGVDKE